MNSPTINIVDTSQEQIHKLVPQKQPALHAGYMEAHNKIANAMNTHVKKALDSFEPTAKKLATGAVKKD